MTSEAPMGSVGGRKVTASSGRRHRVPGGFADVRRNTAVARATTTSSALESPASESPVLAPPNCTAPSNCTTSSSATLIRRPARTSRPRVNVGTSRATLNMSIVNRAGRKPSSPNCCSTRCAARAHTAGPLSVPGAQRLNAYEVGVTTPLSDDAAELFGVKNERVFDTNHSYSDTDACTEPPPRATRFHSVASESRHNDRCGDKVTA